MATNQTPAQQRKIHKVMHEFKQGDLETSHGRKVKNPKQAIAIALSEADASKPPAKRKKTKQSKASSKAMDTREKKNH